MSAGRRQLSGAGPLGPAAEAAAARPAPRTRRHPGERLWIAGAGLVALLALAPIFGLAWFAARGSGPLWPHLIQSVIPVAVRQTAVLLAGVAVMVTVIGVGTAWLVAMYRFPGRAMLQWALLLPLAVPTYIAAYAYLDVVHPVGPVQTALRTLLGITEVRGLWFPEIRSMGGAVFLLGLVLYPYVYLPVRALFLLQSASLLDASRMLGAGRRRAFFAVALPLARPAVAVGLSLALMEALNDIGASEFLGIRTLTVAIYTTWVTRSSIEGAAQIALVMLAVVFALVLLERSARRHQRFSAPAHRSRPPAPRRLAGWRAALAVLACALPVLLGFLVPALYLFTHAWRRIAEFGIPPGLWTWTATSLGYAAIASAVAVAVGLGLAYCARLVRRPSVGALLRIASIGYAIPGTVLAVGLLVPLASFDNLVDGWARNLFGISTGLLIVGSGAGLVLAYVLRFLAVSIGGIEAGLAKVSPSLDMAARSLGTGPLAAVRRVHLPLLRPAVVASALLVFVDCMKELPATLLLRPFNFESLATQVYGEAARGTYEAGSVSACAIVIAGLVPVLLLARASDKGIEAAASARGHDG